MSTSDRSLGLVVLKNLALDEIEAHERLLTSLTEHLSGEGLEAAADTVDRRLGQLRIAVRVADELLAGADAAGERALPGPIAEDDRPAIDLRNVQARVTDGQALGHIRLAALTDYLRERGWVEGPASPTARRRPWSLAQRSSEGHATLAVPAHERFADYALRMGEIVGQLAETEDRSQLAVLADLLTLSAGASRQDASPAIPEESTRRNTP